MDSLLARLIPFALLTQTSDYTQTLASLGRFRFYTYGQGLDHQEATINIRGLAIEASEDQSLDTSRVTPNF